MPTLKLTLEYDGTRFHGWQYQPGLRTIQGALHEALEMVLRTKIRTITAAGRTDAGVHARGQVVTVPIQEEGIDLHRLAVAISSLFKGELSIVAAETVSDTFDARHSARLKQYRYRILNRPAPPTLDRNQCWHITGVLNVALMEEEAALLTGRHDFSSFQGTGCVAKTPIKDIKESKILLIPPFIEYVIVGRSFLKQMVRTIVGTLVARGRGVPALPPILEIVAARNRQAAGPTAPAHGLCLDWVRYEEAEM